MDVYRKWFCACTGQPLEIAQGGAEEEGLEEPRCPLCGATPSSDPKRTISYRDFEDWED